MEVTMESNIKDVVDFYVNDGIEILEFLETTNGLNEIDIKNIKDYLDMANSFVKTLDRFDRSRVTRCDSLRKLIKMVEKKFSYHSAWLCPKTT